MTLVSQPDPDIFRRTSGLFLIFSFLLLGITYLFGPEINGAQRWVRAGPFSFQSSELLKLAVPLFLANFLYGKKLPIQRKEIFFSLVIIFCCFSTSPFFGFVASKEVVVAPWFKKPDVEFFDATGDLLTIYLDVTLPALHQ